MLNIDVELTVVFLSHRCYPPKTTCHRYQLAARRVDCLALHSFAGVRNCQVKFQLQACLHIDVTSPFRTVPPSAPHRYPPLRSRLCR